MGVKFLVFIDYFGLFFDKPLKLQLIFINLNISINKTMGIRSLYKDLTVRNYA